MGYSLVSGHLTEDFNYGYPYGLKIPPLPGEFYYDVAYVTDTFNTNYYYEPAYNRKQFKIQYSFRSLDPLNTDQGLHGGARNATGYYLMWPIMGNSQSRTLALEVTVTTGSVLTYYRSWDGYVGDEFFLQVNGLHYMGTNLSAGHGWTQDTINLKPGTNQIIWVVQSGSVNLSNNTGTTRSGVTDTSSTAPAPVVNRYFRLANISVTNVTQDVRPRWKFAGLNAGSSLSASGHVAVTGKAKLIAFSSLEPGPNQKFASAFLQATSSFTTDKLTQASNKVALSSDSSVTADGHTFSVHSSDDAGLVMQTHAELSVFIPIDTPQTVVDLVFPSKIKYATMPTPVLVDGSPLISKYYDSQTTTFTTAGSHTTSPAVNPSSVDHVLPHNATYRWVAADITGGIDASVYAWPERGGGPSLISADPFAPTIHPKVQFDDFGLTYIEYAQVVTFYWRYSQHMWVNLGSQTCPHTFYFVGMWAPPTKSHRQHILASGGNLTNPASFNDIVNDAIEGSTTTLGTGGEASYTGWDYFGMYENGVFIAASPAGAIPARFIWAHIDWRPVIFTVIFETTSTKIFARHRNHIWSKNIKGNNGTANKFLIGKKPNYIGAKYTMHGSLLEIGFFNHSMSLQQIRDNEDYLMGVYKFERFR